MKKTDPTKSKRVLLTFVGSHDPFRGEGLASGDGPVLSLFNHEQFDCVHLFYNNEEYLRRASGVRSEMLKRRPETEIAYQEIKVIDPTDHDLLYELMHNRCVELSGRHGKTANITVATSSGTPPMQTCWLLLVLGGVLKAKLVQLAPPHKVRPGESPVREIKPSLDRFPRITSPERLKRELSVATRRVEIYERERAALARETAENLIGQLIELLLELAVLRRRCQEGSNDAETQVRPAFVRSVGLGFVVHSDAEFFVFHHCGGVGPGFYRPWHTLVDRSRPEAIVWCGGH